MRKRFCFTSIDETEVVASRGASTVTVIGPPFTFKRKNGAEVRRVTHGVAFIAPNGKTWEDGQVVATIKAKRGADVAIQIE